MFPYISKDLSEELRSPIGHQVLFGEGGSAVHEHHQLHDALDLVQVAHRGMKCAHQVDGHGTSGLFTLRGREIRPKLADPWFAVDLGDMASQEEQIAAAQKRYKSCHRRRQFRKRNVEGVEPLVYRQGFSSITLTVSADMLTLNMDDLLDVAPQLVSAGNPTIFVAVKNKEIVDRALLDAGRLKTLIGPDSEPLCVFVFTPTLEGAYSRMFAPLYGISEDPATGSSTGPLASFMMRNCLTPGTAGRRLMSEQGTKMGRPSMLHVCIQGENGKVGIDVGGYVTPLTEATMRF